MRFTSLLKQDIVLQFRHGFYYAYLLVSLLYIAVLKSIPSEFLDFTITFVVFSDPAIFGFFFIGAIVLLERGQNTLEGLFITPVSIHEYFLSKMISLSLIAQVTSFFITFTVYGTSFKTPLLFLGVLLTSALFILIGLGLATYAKTFNLFIVMSVVYMSVLFTPLLAFFHLYDHSLFYLIPTTASLLLMKSAFVSISVPELVYALGFLCTSIVLTYLWTYKLFQKHIIMKIGADS